MISSFKLDLLQIYLRPNNEEEKTTKYRILPILIKRLKLGLFLSPQMINIRDSITNFTDVN